MINCRKSESQYYRRFSECVKLCDIRHEHGRRRRKQNCPLYYLRLQTVFGVVQNTIVEDYIDTYDIIKPIYISYIVTASLTQYWSGLVNKEIITEKIR